MALVDILAEDFMSARVQSSARLQVALNTSLLLGAGLMSMLTLRLCHLKVLLLNGRILSTSMNVKS
jgi:hypothetical protein